MPLTDCRAALEEYRRRWGTLDPVEEWDEDFHSPPYKAVEVVGGTFGILFENSAKFITLGSISRGIPRKKWDLLFGDFKSFSFTFYPRANVLAVLERVEPR